MDQGRGSWLGIFVIPVLVVAAWGVIEVAKLIGHWLSSLAG